MRELVPVSGRWVAVVGGRDVTAEHVLREHA